jgi:hypothetical protein
VQQQRQQQQQQQQQRQQQQRQQQQRQQQQRLLQHRHLQQRHLQQTKRDSWPQIFSGKRRWGCCSDMQSSWQERLPQSPAFCKPLMACKTTGCMARGSPGAPSSTSTTALRSRKTVAKRKQAAATWRVRRCAPVAPWAPATVG